MVWLNVFAAVLCGFVGFKALQRGDKASGYLNLGMSLLNAVIVLTLY